MILPLLGEVSQSHFQVLTYFLICLTYPLTGLPPICEGKTDLSYYIISYRIPSNSVPVEVRTLARIQQSAILFTDVWPLTLCL